MCVVCTRRKALHGAASLVPARPVGDMADQVIRLVFGPHVRLQKQTARR